MLSVLLAQAVYERRLTALQEEHQRLSEELAKLEYGSGAGDAGASGDEAGDSDEPGKVTVSGRDLRQLDDAIQSADVEVTSWK